MCWIPFLLNDLFFQIRHIHLKTYRHNVWLCKINVYQIFFCWILHKIYGIVWLFLFVCFGITCFVDIHSKNKFKYTSNILIFILMSKLYSIFRYVIVTFWMFFFFINLLVFAFIQFVPHFLLPNRDRDEYKHIGLCPNVFVCIVNRW